MRHVFTLLFILVIQGCSKKAQPTVQLPPVEEIPEVVKVLSEPNISADSVFFLNTAIVTLSHDVDNVAIHYSVDGSEVTEDSPIYVSPLNVDINIDLKCKAYHPDYVAPSNLSNLSLRKCISTPELILKQSSTLPNEPFMGTGLTALSDLKKGELKGEESPNWIGFQEEEIVFEYKLDKPIYCNGISISTLSNPLKGVLNPQRFEIDVDDELVGFLQIKAPAGKTPPELKIWDFSVKNKIKKSIKIKVVNAKTVPNWYEDQMEKPWIFIDEIIIN